MINNYAKAYVEVLEIIKYFPDEEYSKIPKDKIEFYENNKDLDYDFKLNPNEDLSKQNISREANAILVTIFRDYFATENQKEKLNLILMNNQKVIEKERAEKYNSKDIFKSNNNYIPKQNVQQEITAETSLVEYKESFFVRFKNFILKIFHIEKK